MEYQNILSGFVGLIFAIISLKSWQLGLVPYSKIWLVVYKDRIEELKKVSYNRNKEPNKYYSTLAIFVLWAILGILFAYLF